MSFANGPPESLQVLLRPPPCWDLNHLSKRYNAEVGWEVSETLQEPLHKLRLLFHSLLQIMIPGRARTVLGCGNPKNTCTHVCVCRIIPTPFASGSRGRMSRPLKLKVHGAVRLPQRFLEKSGLEAGMTCCLELQAKWCRAVICITMGRTALKS